LRFSPDGKKVRFTRFTDDFAGSIWEYSLESGEVYPILPDWEAEYFCCGSWTPNGKYFVFEAMHDAGPQIWAIENMPDGSPDPEGPFKLTSETMDFKRPTISSDGRTIYAIGWQLRGEIVERAPGDRDFHPVDGLKSMSVDQVEFSLDGKWAAFVSYPQGHLWQKKLEREKATQLTFGSMRVANPRISPNGEMIAFEGWEPGEDKRIYMVPSEGGDVALVSNEELVSWVPSWSPDSTKLMFSERSDTSPIIYDLVTGTVSPYGGAEPIYGAIWAPDGSKLVGWSEENLVVYDFNSGKRQIVVEDTPSYTRYWAADSKHVYLVDHWMTEGERSVYKLRLEDKSIEKLLHVGDERLTWGTGNLWVGVTPEGAIMYLRDHSIHNIYALEWNAD
jgi:Tol biopolymer transport system component